MNRIPDLPFLLKLATEYEVLELIGSGSFGWVHLCRRLGTGQEFACKIIQISRDHSDDYLPEFEINFNALPSHINIVQRLEWWQEKVDTRRYLVVRMEHCEQSLEQAIRHGFFLGADGEIKKEFMKSVMRGALSGLIFIHESLLIHRDIKSANILITHDGIAKIADFGIVTRSSVARSLTLGVGTPVYTAPEVYLGDYGNKIDVFSYGVVLFEVYKFEFARKEDIRSIMIRKQFPNNFGAGFNEGEMSAVKTAIMLTLSQEPEERPSALEVFRLLFDDGSKNTKVGNQNTIASHNIDPPATNTSLNPMLTTAADSLPVGPAHWPPTAKNSLPVRRTTTCVLNPISSQAQLPIGPADLPFRPVSSVSLRAPANPPHFSASSSVMPTAPILD